MPESAGPAVVMFPLQANEPRTGRIPKLHLASLERRNFYSRVDPYRANCQLSWREKDRQADSRYGRDMRDIGRNMAALCSMLGVATGGDEA